VVAAVCTVVADAGPTVDVRPAVVPDEVLSAVVGVGASVLCVVVSLPADDPCAPVALLELLCCCETTTPCLSAERYGSTHNTSWP
jgi:hypothetical protein